MHSQPAPKLAPCCWPSAEYDLHTAVDKLQSDADRDGLVDRIGQDAVQRIIADALLPFQDSANA